MQVTGRRGFLKRKKEKRKKKRENPI